MAKTRIFQATRVLEDSITEHLDLLYPLVAGLWGLRVQLAGYLAHQPDASEADLQARLLTGSGIRGSGLRPVLGRTWDKQRSATGGLGLVAVIAVYETWCDRIVSRLPAAQRSAAAKALQWPPSSLSPMKKAPLGIDHAIAVIRRQPPRHAGAMTAIAESTSADGVVAMDDLGVLLVAYRALKERRNVIVHGGGVADDFTALWDQRGASFTPAQLGLRHSLRLGDVNAGTPTSVDVGQVSGLIRVILQIAATVDRHIGVSHAGQLEILDRFPATKANPMKVRAKRSEWDRHLRNVLRTRGIPGPRTMTAVTEMLHSEGLVL